MSKIEYDVTKMLIFDRVLIRYIGDDSEVILPNGIIGIAEHAFCDKSEIIEHVSFPHGLKWIGSHAFSGCGKISELIFPDTLVEISDYSFEKCVGLHKVVMPPSVYRIGNRAFTECSSLTIVKCAEGLGRIESEAFCDCSRLEKLVLPESCEYISEDCVKGCKDITIIAPEDSEAEWFADAMYLPFQNSTQIVNEKWWKIISESEYDDFRIRNGVLVEYFGASEEIIIPEEVEVIGGEVFCENLQLSSVIIPENVQIIGERAFSGCASIAEVAKNGTCTYVAKEAFSSCAVLEKVVFNGKGAFFQEKAFQDCSNLKTVFFPSENVFVEGNVFEGCSRIDTIKYPVRNWTISEIAFENIEGEVLYYISSQTQNIETLQLNKLSRISVYSDIMSAGALKLEKLARKLDVSAEYLEMIPSNLNQYLITLPEEEISSSDEINDGSETDLDSIDGVTDSVDYKKEILIDGYPKLNDCDIILDDEIISGDQLVRLYMQFVTKRSSVKEHCESLSVHTGSICFNAVTLVIAVIEAMQRNTASSDSIVESLYDGDLVLVSYSSKSPSKYFFRGIDSNGYACLEKDNKTKDKLSLPRSSWHRITPYFGSSENTTNVGIREDLSEKTKFYHLFFDKKPMEVPKTMNTSIVCLSKRKDFDYLWNNLKISVNSEVFSLSSLVTAAFYSDANTYYYPGNPGKNDPTIKVTDSVYKSRELLNEISEYNKVVGVLVFSDSYVEKSLSELQSVITDTRVPFTFTVVTLSRFESSSLLEIFEDRNVFACTSDFLENYIDSKSTDISTGRHLQTVSNQVDIIRKRKMEDVVLSTGISEKDYYELREQILSFKYREYDLVNKDLFIMESMAVLKVLLSAVFSIHNLPSVINKLTLEERIDTIQKNIDYLPDDDQIKARNIIETIKLFAMEVGDRPQKADELIKLLERYPKGKVALVVPKKYYAELLYQSEPKIRRMIDHKRLYISTAVRFDTNIQYEAVIFVSNSFGKGFSPWRCYCAKNVIALLYDFEKKLYHFAANSIKSILRELNNKNYITTVTETTIENNDKGEVSRMVSDAELDLYIEKVSNDYLSRPIVNYSWGKQESASEVIALVVFESGERAFLTKYYEPYILDEEKQEIYSRAVSELVAGDVLVFNSDYYGTRDIVDVLLSQKVAEDTDSNSLRKAYEDSRYWKRVLRDYATIHHLTDRQIANRLRKEGVEVQEAAIVRWLDENSHIVGPQDPANFQRIGFLVGDDELFNNPDRFVNACKSVRAQRRAILKDISRCMVASITGNTEELEKIGNDTLVRQIGQLATLYRIDGIQFVNKTLPTGMTNRPIEDIEV